MSTKNKKTENQKQCAKRPKHLFLTIFVCIFVLFAIIFGIVVGVISATRSKSAVVKYEGLTMNEEVASFFVTQYKYYYMQSLSSSGVSGVEDSPGFWNKKDSDGKTHGELLSENVEKYLREIIVANYLYDNATSLSSTDKKVISNSIEELLVYRAGGSESEFDKAVKPYGFSYDSFDTAVTMLYKASMLKSILFGADGSNLKGYENLTNEYLAEYAHVQLLFIRTETTFVYGSDGNPVKGENGQYETRELTEEEKAERELLIAQIQGYIDAIGVGDAYMGEEMFKYYLQKYDEGDEHMHADGYYFHEKAEYTAYFATHYPEIVNKAFSMSIGDFAYVELDGSACFIYRYAPTSNAYSLTYAEDCFTDFYSDASTKILDDIIAGFTSDVVVTDKYKDIDVVMLPYNHLYIPRFS